MNAFFIHKIRRYLLYSEKDLESGFKNAVARPKKKN